VLDELEVPPAFPHSNPQRSIYCSRTLNLRSIKAIGGGQRTLCCCLLPGQQGRLLLLLHSGDGSASHSISAHVAARM
jgi:hypothetical protein